MYLKEPENDVLIFIPISCSNFCTHCLKNNVKALNKILDFSIKSHNITHGLFQALKKQNSTSDTNDH